MRFLHGLAAFQHALHEIIDLLRERVLKVCKRFVVREVAEIRRELRAREQVFSAVQRELERLAEVEHRGVAPAEVVALRRELDAADDGIVARLALRETELFERGDDGLVVEELRHAAALRDDADGFFQQLVARLRVQPHGEVRLRQADVRLRLQAEERHVVHVVAPVRVDAADRDVEADREAGEIFRAAAVAQVHDLVELQPEALEELERARLRHAVCAAFFIIRREDLVEAARRERRRVRLHLEDDEQEPQRLHGLVERLGRPLGDGRADVRDQ